MQIQAVWHVGLLRAPELVFCGLFWDVQFYRESPTVGTQRTQMPSQQTHCGSPHILLFTIVFVCCYNALHALCFLPMLPVSLQLFCIYTAWHCICTDAKLVPDALRLNAVLCQLWCLSWLTALLAVCVSCVCVCVRQQKSSFSLGSEVVDPPTFLPHSILECLWHDHQLSFCLWHGYHDTWFHLQCLNVHMNGSSLASLTWS